ncbi:MAG: hypothetical protein HOE69_04765 [Euryarchaeota archaeon]|jgi:hypothetical protein|nr:hypothetical protein [Euryarchaeota archaeon]
MENKNMKHILLVLILSVLMAMVPFTSPKLVVDDAPNEGASARSITSTHIEMWSESSSLNPQIPFENCILSDIVVDSYGNTYVSGTFTSEIGFGSTTLNTFTDDYSVFVAKISTSGTWDWAVQSTGDNAHSRAMTLDTNETNLYVVGNLVGNNSFGEHFASSVDKNMFVLSIDADTGGFKNIYTPSSSVSSSGISNAEAVIARTGGGVYIAGEYELMLDLPGIPPLPFSNGHTNAFVASLSEQGWEWSTSTSCYLSICGDENATSLTLDHNGNVAVLGEMVANTTFGANGEDAGPVLLGAGFTDVFVWTINSVNSFSINAISTNSTGVETPAKIIALGEELIISGNFVGEMNLSGINVSSYGGPVSSGFVGSLTFNGQQENWNWVRTVNGSSDSGPTSGRFTSIQLYIPWQITDIDVGQDNTIIVAGEYWGEAQLDSLIMPGTGSFNNLDAFVAQLSSQGDWLNMMIVGGPGPDGMTRVATSSNGQMHIGLDSDSVAITFGDSTHYPNDRSVIIGAFEWDRDKDSISDEMDQCEGYDDKIDEDNDGIPDACDPLIDSDGDSISDTLDRCPFIHAGDLDEDGDGCPDEILVGCMDDNAHNYTNLANSNSTTCDYDWDNDGTDDDDEIVGCMDDTADNFDPSATDPGQCNFTPSCPDCSVDGDDDEDGVPNETDQCPETPGGTPVHPDGCGGDGTVDPQGNASVWGAIGDCDPTNTSVNCQEEMIIAGVGGAGLFGGSIITRVLRPGVGKGRGPGLGIGDIADAKDAYDFIAKKDAKKVKTTGGSDHYFKPGVERQGAMSTAADTALDDYVED